ncbi:MAG: helix-turn-helix domain-containing protein [Flavobacteriales bacterium]|nr:helix-turn-helix domain-containing protein [Flavobacteriales bacterium]
MGQGSNIPVTQEDLNVFYQKITTEFDRLMSEKHYREFYTPREFSNITGIKYPTVIHYCNNGKIKARQHDIGGSWIIPRSEIDRFKDEADDNLWNP